MPTVTYGSRAAANDARGRVSKYLAPRDDRRSKTVKLRSGAPERVVQRLESEAFGSQETTRSGSGQAQLTGKERRSLERTTSFDWSQHGLQAMAAKAALEERGADAWQDYYEPGEGVDSSLSKLRSAKGRAGQGGRASIGVEADIQTDMGDVGNVGRRARQAEQAMGSQIQSAKEPAILSQDADAIDFLREEEELGGSDPFDIAFNQSDRWGRPVATGRDAELVEERHESRSSKARAVDEVKQAPVTRDPIKWATNPGDYDFPGVDTLDPEKVHAGRSDRAQSLDEAMSAPLADSPEEWADNPGELDLGGVDEPVDVSIDLDVDPL